MNALGYITLISMVIMTILILLQTRGAGLGAEETAARAEGSH